MNKIQVKVSDIINSLDALRTLNNTKLSMDVSQRLSENIGPIDMAVTNYEERRQALVKKYGREQDDGSHRVEGDKLDEWNIKMKELYEEEISIKVNFIDPSEIPDSVEITPNEVNSLKWCLKKQKAKEKAA